MNNEQKPAQNSDKHLRSFIIVTPYLLDTQANVLSVFAATVEPVGQPMEVTGRASWIVAFGEQGELVLDDRDEHISLYLHDGIQYSLASRTPRPDGVGSSCNKAVSSRAVHVQGWLGTSAVTHELHRADLHHLGEVRHEGGQWLRGVLYPDTLVYEQWRGRDYIIILHQPHGQITLEPPRGREMGRWMVVCVLCWRPYRCRGGRHTDHGHFRHKR